MHDTVGIIYQFSNDRAYNFYDSEATTSAAPQVNDNDNGEGPTRKRRRFNEISREIQPIYET